MVSKDGDIVKFAASINILVANKPPRPFINKIIAPIRKTIFKLIIIY